MSTHTAPLTGTFVADKDHSSAHFTVRHMKVSRFRASFRDIDARLTGSGGELSLEGTAQVDSISIDGPADFRRHVVEGSDFFDARRFPALRFSSTRVALDGDGDGAVVVDGELTMKGLRRPVTATGTLRGPVEDILGGRSAALELRATLDRRDWGLDWQMSLPDGDDVLDWTVEIDVLLELHEAA